MLKWVASKLRWLADWLDPNDHQLVPFDLLKIAMEEVKVAESLLANHTGSFKRVMVFKSILNRVPKASRRNIGLAIELALRNQK